MATEIDQIANSWGFVPLPREIYHNRVTALVKLLPRYEDEFVLVATRKAYPVGRFTGIRLDRYLGILEPDFIAPSGDYLTVFTKIFFNYVDGEVYRRRIGNLFPSVLPAPALDNPLIITAINSGPALEIIGGDRNVRRWFEKHDQLLDFQRGQERLGRIVFSLN